VTPQRRFIFQVLENRCDHPTVEEIYDEVRALVPDISLATVYNTLRELVELGEVRELNLGKGRSRYDPNTTDHQHLICVQCQTVTDVRCDTRCLELTPEERQGYRILTTTVIFNGICPACQKA